MNLIKNKLPNYFYDINAILPDGKMRWYDEFCDEAPSLIQPKDMDLQYQYARRARNEAYSRWQASFFAKTPTGEYVPMFKPKMLKWQAIRVLRFNHSESNKKDWWENFQDAVFRVFVEPETVYDAQTTAYKQWYLLSPEDGFLVNQYELENKGPNLPKRDYNNLERYLSANKLLRRARFIPVECCQHLRHETVGGELIVGL